MQELQFRDYDEFLNSGEWKEVAEMVKERDSHKCVICGSNENLNAHHLRYRADRLDEDDIITVCSNCHQCLHNAVDEIKKTAGSGVRQIFNEALSNIVIDFYKKSFSKSNGNFEICKHTDFIKLREILEQTIESQIYNFYVTPDNNWYLVKDIPKIIKEAGFENLSKTKIIELRIDFIKRAVKAGMKPYDIQRRLRISTNQYNKYIDKMRDRGDI